MAVFMPIIKCLDIMQDFQNDKRKLCYQKRHMAIKTFHSLVAILTTAKFTVETEEVFDAEVFCVIDTFCTSDPQLAAWKVFKYGVNFGLYFPAFGPEITPYFDTFHAVIALSGYGLNEAKMICFNYGIRRLI